MTLETSHSGVRGSDLTPKMALLKARSRVNAMTDSDMQEMLILPLCNQMQIKPLEDYVTQHLEGSMSTDMRDEAVQKRCVPTLWQTRAKPMAVGT